jgi:hypothetical protein
MATLKDLAAPSLQDLKIPAALQSPGMPSHLSAPQGEDLSRKPAETKAPEPAKEAVKEAEPESAQQETQAEPAQTEQVQETDPWLPVKERFKDRIPAEVLDEYETLKREREDFRTKAEEREIAAKELQEKLVAYDARHDPDFAKNVTEPIQEARADLIEVCLGDVKVAEEVYALQNNKELEPKERISKLKAILEENGITHSDWIASYKRLEKTLATAKDYQTNYQQHRAHRDQERLKAMEMQAQQNQANIRQVHRTATFKTEAELKKLGLDFLTGMDDVRNEHMLGLEKALSGAGYDQEEEVKNNLVGRLFLKNAPTILAALKERDELKAAARSKPSEATKETKKADAGISDTKALEAKIFGRA